MAVGLCVWLVCSGRKSAPVSGALVSLSGAEVKAQVFAKVDEERESASATAAPPDTQNSASTKLTDAESVAISERMAEAKRLLVALDVTNAKREMEHTSDTHRTVAVRVEAPTVEQLAPIYDLLSKASKDFPAASNAAKEFRNKAALFLKKAVRSDFQVVIKSTNTVTGLTDFKVIEAKAKSVTVKYENGSVHVLGPFRAANLGDAGNEFGSLFPEP